MFSKKLTTILVIIIVSHISKPTFAASSVWKISINNDYLYIGGTIHILPKSEYPLPKEFMTAYNNSDAIVLETQLPATVDQSFQHRLMQKVTYQAPKKLSNVISKATFLALEQYLAKFGVNLMDLDKFKPGFIVSMIAVLEAKQAGIAEEGVDAYFNQRAAKDNKKLEYLESVDFQINLLANMGMGNEEALIKSTLSQMAQFEATFKKLIPAWRAGNEKLLTELVIKSMKELDPASYKTMLTDRNHNWITHIENMFKDDDKEFILVGVGHLIGEESVINLLRNAGYCVEKI